MSKKKKTINPNRKTFVGLFPRKTKTKAEALEQIKNKEIKKEIKEYM